MNGRVYDALTARFLSPDPIVQDPFNTQSYNRYSYCMNNPIMFTDPSGYTFHIDKDGRTYWDDELTGTPASNEGSSSSGPNTTYYGGKSGTGSGGTPHYCHGSSEADPQPKWEPIFETYAAPIYRPNISSTYNTDGNVVKMGGNTDGRSSGMSMKMGGETGPENDPLKGCFSYSYSEENLAYKFLWRISHDKNGKWSSESFALLTNMGVLVLPNVGYINGKFFKNEENEAYYAEAWLKYNVSNRNIIGTDLSIIATIHTHPWVDQISGGDLSLYQFGNIYVLDPKNLWLGFKGSKESNIYQTSVATFSNIIEDKWSIKTNNKMVKYFH